jgi:hypothetical protein
MDVNEINYGPVYILGGEEAGRIGYYDDDDTLFERDLNHWQKSIFSDDLAWEDYENDNGEVEKSLEVAIVYFGDYWLSSSYTFIPFEYIRPATTDDLLMRRESLSKQVDRSATRNGRELEVNEELKVYKELHYVETELVGRMVDLRYGNNTNGAKVFISHSSKDKQIATWISTDLKAAGHTPWIDDSSIMVGESIPKKITQGISECDFVVVILSEHAISSNWVEREWQTKYWDEVNNNTVHILPILHEDCEIPELLKTKRYADFRNSYNNGLEDLLLAIDKLYKQE